MEERLEQQRGKEVPRKRGQAKPEQRKKECPISRKGKSLEKYEKKNDFQMSSKTFKNRGSDRIRLQIRPGNSILILPNQVSAPELHGITVS